MFRPEGNFLNRELMKIQYRHLVNEQNISELSSIAIKKIMKDESLADKNAFLHHLISVWVDNQKVKDVSFIKQLKRTIKRTKIVLTDEDKFELALLEERSFSEYRHIKVLEVSTYIMPKESVGVKFVRAQLYQKTNRLDFIKEADLLISNKRIILESENNAVESFFWEKIKSYSYTGYGFEFVFENKKYVLRIHDQVSLNNTFKNMISKKIRNVISKEKTV